MICRSQKSMRPWALVISSTRPRSRTWREGEKAVCNQQHSPPRHTPNTLRNTSAPPPPRHLACLAPHRTASCAPPAAAVQLHSREPQGRCNAAVRSTHQRRWMPSALPVGQQFCWSLHCCSHVQAICTGLINVKVRRYNACAGSSVSSSFSASSDRCCQPLAMGL